MFDCDGSHSVTPSHSATPSFPRCIRANQAFMICTRTCPTSRHWSPMRSDLLPICLSGWSCIPRFVFMLVDDNDG